MEDVKLKQWINIEVLKVRRLSNSEIGDVIHLMLIRSDWWDGIVQSHDIDICLMVCLLRKLGSETLNDPAKLTELRNVVTHLQESKVTISFDESWREIFTTVGRFAGPFMNEEYQRTLDLSFQGNVRRFVNEMTMKMTISRLNTKGISEYDRFDKTLMIMLGRTLVLGHVSGEYNVFEYPLQKKVLVILKGLSTVFLNVDTELNEFSTKIVEQCTDPWFSQQLWRINRRLERQHASQLRKASCRILTSTCMRIREGSHRNLPGTFNKTCEGSHRNLPGTFNKTCEGRYIWILDVNKCLVVKYPLVDEEKRCRIMNPRLKENFQNTKTINTAFLRSQGITMEHFERIKKYCNEILQCVEVHSSSLPQVDMSMLKMQSMEMVKIAFDLHSSQFQASHDLSSVDGNIFAFSKMNRKNKVSLDQKKTTYGMEQDNRYFSKRKLIQCQMCIDHNEALHWCNTCRRNICNFCKLYHEKVWIVKHHDVQSFQF